jgi:hypothetical protein
VTRFFGAIVEDVGIEPRMHPKSGLKNRHHHLEVATMLTAYKPRGLPRATLHCTALKSTSNHRDGARSMSKAGNRAVELFDRSLKGFRYSYPSKRFINERDVASDIQTRLRDIVGVEEPTWRVFDNERAVRKNGKKIYQDLVIMEDES